MSTSVPPAIRVVVAEDAPLIRAGTVAALRAAEGIRVTAEAPDVAHALEVGRREGPDALVLDLRTPRMGALSALAELTAAGIPVLAITTLEDDVTVLAALRDGVAGVLLDQATPAELVSAVRAVAAGAAVLAEPIAHQLAYHTRGQGHELFRTAVERLDSRDERELQLLRMIGEGLSDAAIAARIGTDAAEVAAEVTRLRTELGLGTRAQAALLAYEIRGQTGAAPPPTPR